MCESVRCLSSERGLCGATVAAGGESASTELAFGSRGPRWAIAVLGSGVAAGGGAESSNAHFPLLPPALACFHRSTHRHGDLVENFAVCVWWTKRVGRRVTSVAKVSAYTPYMVNNKTTLCNWVHSVRRQASAGLGGVMKLVIAL